MLQQEPENASVFNHAFDGQMERRTFGYTKLTMPYFHCLPGGALTLISAFAKPLFILGGHSPEIQHLEIIYFKTLCLGGRHQRCRRRAGLFLLGTGPYPPCDDHQHHRHAV
jgi:MATE family multidrug resistance protein